MATQLFLLDSNADTHLGTNNANLRGTNTSWVSKLLGLTRGAGVVASAATATVTGATPGIEVDTTGSLRLEWLSPPLAADVTISGTITANIWASENNMSANVAINVVIEIVRAATLTGLQSSNALVEIVRSTRVTEVNVTTRAANNFTTGMTSGAYSAQTVNRGDRLRIRVFGDDAGTMATGFTFNIGYAGTTSGLDGDSYITFTENFLFEAVPGVETLTINQDSGAGEQNIGSAAANERVAQSYTAKGEITRGQFMFSKVGTPADNVILELQADSGGAPSGTALVSDSLSASTDITTSFIFYNFDLPFVTTVGQTYWLVLSRSGSVDAANFIRCIYDNTNPYSGGLRATYNGTSWSTVSGEDLRFKVYEEGVVATTLYLTDTASAVSTASVDREAWTDRGSGVVNDVTNTATGFTAPIQVTDTAGGTVVDWFTKQLQAVTLSGLAWANVRALESNIAANASLRVEIARVDADGTNSTVWGSWCIAPDSTDNGELSTSEVARTAWVSGDDLAITAGQRLRIRLYIDDQSSQAMVNTHTVTTYYAGTSGGASGDTFIAFTTALVELAAALPPYHWVVPGRGDAPRLQQGAVGRGAVW